MNKNPNCTECSHTKASHVSGRNCQAEGCQCCYYSLMQLVTPPTKPGQEGVVKTRQFKYKEYVSIEDYQSLLTELEALREIAKTADGMKNWIESEYVKVVHARGCLDDPCDCSCEIYTEEKEEILLAYCLAKKAAGLGGEGKS